MDNGNNPLTYILFLEMKNMISTNSGPNNWAELHAYWYTQAKIHAYTYSYSFHNSHWLPGMLKGSLHKECVTFTLG